jgi:hypothetical protein
MCYIVKHIYLQAHSQNFFVVVNSKLQNYLRVKFVIAGLTERRGRVIKTSASYSGGHGFNSWPGVRLS